MVSRSRSVIQVWTDGSKDNSSNRPGGWCAVLISPNTYKARVIGGAVEARTTNNRMELSPVLAAFSVLKRNCSVTLFTDSMYVIYGMRRILENRKLLEKNGDLWEKLQIQVHRLDHEINLEHVKGHTGWENGAGRLNWNEFCDTVAGWCAKNRKSIDYEMDTDAPIFPDGRRVNGY